MTYSTSARVLLACAALAVLSACGTEKAAPPQVASLPGTSTAAASGSSSAPPPDEQAKRPQLRLDSSNEEISTLWGVYDVCLKEHGHKMLTGRGDSHAGAAGLDGAAADSPDMNDDSPASKKAETECAEKLPLQPPEMSAETNPHYADDYRDYVTCLNAHGVAVHATEPLGSGWTYNDGVTQKLDETQRDKVDKDCQVSEFTDH